MSSDSQGNDGDGGERAAPTKVSRRAFLGYGGTTLAAIALPACYGSDDALADEQDDLDVIGLTIAEWVTVQRADDLVNLRFGFVNFTRSSDGFQMVRSASPALIVVMFPPQHLAERVFDTGATATAPVAHNLAQNSRVVFYVPDDAPPFELSTRHLLSRIGELAMNVHANAAPGPSPLMPPDDFGGRIGTSSGVAGELALPHALETAIELPWRLLISPNIFCAWAHAATPVEAPNGRVELWHTRLGVTGARGVGVDEHRTDLRTARAIWDRRAPDSSLADGQSSLSASDRSTLAWQTGYWPPLDHPERQWLLPTAMPIDQLMLSSLGGWLDSTTDFPASDGTAGGAIARWIHRAALGRDYYVQVAYRGFAFPFQHEVLVLKISERKLDGHDAAYMWKRYVPLIVERTRSYEPGLPSLDPALRMMPLRSLSLIDENLPDVASVEGQPYAMLTRADGGGLLRLHMEAVDRAGNRVRFDAPILWVPKGPYLNNLGAGTLANAYAAGAGAAARATTAGQRLWLAPSGRAAARPTAAAEGDTGETTFETQALTFNAVALPADVYNARTYRVGWFPVLAFAELAVEAIRQVAGTAQASPFHYHLDYVRHGFASSAGQNPRELLMQLAPNQSIGVSFSAQADRAGGFVTPNLDIQGLSRLTGPVTEVLRDPSGAIRRGADGAATLINTAMTSPEALFPIGNALDSAKLFGCVQLSNILAPDTFRNMVPKFVTDALDEVARYRRMLDEITSLVTRVRDAVPSNLPAEIDAYATTVRTTIDDVTREASKLADALFVTLRNQLEAGQVPAAELATRIGDALREWPDLLRRARTTLLTSKVGPQLFARAPGLEVAVRSLGSILDRLIDLGAEVAGPIEQFLRGIELVKSQQVTLEWKPTLQPWPAGAPIFMPRKTDGLTLTATMRGRAQGNQPAGADLLCSLEQFSLALLGDDPIITVHFSKLQFRQRMGKKPEVDVVFDGFEFGGPLAFIQTLKDAIPIDGFSDPPDVDITPTGLVASYTLALPAIAVGMFSLENLGISARLEVPFIGDALSLKFMFATREKPFLLTVQGLGGSGYFGLVLTPAGIVMLEAQLEFGAHVSLDFGVASGAVTVMGGIYFGLQTQPTVKATLIGFLRIRGEVDVLGLISASIELRCELEYATGGDAGSGKVIGRASLEIEVSVLFFSETVRVSYERKLVGSNGDPTFAQIMGPCDEGDLDGPDAICDTEFPWLDYQAAFAPIPEVAHVR